MATPWIMKESNYHAYHTFPTKALKTYATFFLMEINNVLPSHMQASLVVLKGYHRAYILLCANTNSGKITRFSELALALNMFPIFLY